MRLVNLKVGQSIVADVAIPIADSYKSENLFASLKRAALGETKIFAAPKLYHVTQIKNLDSIKKNGLTPKIGERTRGGHGKVSNKLIFLSDKPELGLLKNKKAALILEIDPSKYTIHHAEGDSVEDIKELGGRYWNSTEDWPEGVEEGDYFSYEPKIIPSKYYDFKMKAIRS